MKIKIIIGCIMAVAALNLTIIGSEVLESNISYASNGERPSVNPGEEHDDGTKGDQPGPDEECYDGEEYLGDTDTCEPCDEEESCTGMSCDETYG